MLELTTSDGTTSTTGNEITLINDWDFTTSNGNEYLTVDTTNHGWSINSDNGWATVPSLTVPMVQTLTLQGNTIMQKKIAIFKITKNDDGKIVNTEFIKEAWYQIKPGNDMGFVVGKDPDLSDYNADELSIRELTSVSF